MVHGVYITLVSNWRLFITKYQPSMYFI